MLRHLVLLLVLQRASGFALIAPVLRSETTRLDARRSFLSSALVALASPLLTPSSARADEVMEAKQAGLSPSAIADIVKADVVKRQFLAR